VPRTTLLAETLFEAACGARNGAEFDAHVESIRKRGGASGTEEMFQALGRSLSGWLLPGVGGAPAPSEGAQVDAMRRLIALPEDSAEGARRFREMVHEAIEQFNEGALGRAIKMFGLAEQMIPEGKVNAAFVEPMVVSGHEYLNPERLKKLSESPERQPYLRPVLRFFRAFAPQKLLDQLQEEARRDKRRLLLTLLEVHGDAGRQAAYERLAADPGGRRTDVYLMRNGVYLLRSIPRTDEAPSTQEVESAHVASLLRPGVPLLLMKEVFQYLDQARHEHAERALLDFLAGIEEALTSLSPGPEEREALLIQADRVRSALARSESPAARAALVEHALSRSSVLGEITARLGDLGRQDLSGHPEIVARIIEAIRADLPRGVLSRLVPMRDADLRHLVAALARTPSPEGGSSTSPWLSGSPVTASAARRRRPSPPSTRPPGLLRSRPACRETSSCSVCPRSCRTWPRPGKRVSCPRCSAGTITLAEVAQ
jgi:hypothetical protein